MNAVIIFCVSVVVGTTVGILVGAFLKWALRRCLDRRNK